MWARDGVPDFPKRAFGARDATMGGVPSLCLSRPPAGTLVLLPDFVHGGGILRRFVFSEPPREAGKAQCEAGPFLRPSPARRVYGREGDLRSDDLEHELGLEPDVRHHSRVDARRTP